MNQMRNSKFTKILWGLMSLYLLNISVDSADHNSQNIPKNLTINDQESIVEIFVEQVLGYENAIKEHDENHSEDHNKKTITKIDLIVPYLIDSTINQSFIKAKRQKFPAFRACLTNSINTLDPPPPKL
jgi:hypothetical protein